MYRRLLNTILQVTSYQYWVFFLLNKQKWKIKLTALFDAVYAKTYKTGSKRITLYIEAASVVSGQMKGSVDLK